MKANMNHELVLNAEAFAIATQMYVRLRRVSARVIDVMYLVHDKNYAKHIIEIANRRYRIRTLCDAFKCVS